MKVGVTITGMAARLGAGVLARLATRLQRVADEAAWQRRAQRASGAQMPSTGAQEILGTSDVQEK